LAKYGDPADYRQFPGDKSRGRQSRIQPAFAIEMIKTALISFDSKIKMIL